jgi:hypothetical protein
MSLDASSAKKARLMTRETLTEDAPEELGRYRTDHRLVKLETGKLMLAAPTYRAPLLYTSHAQWRLPQRNLAPWQVEYVLMHGTVFHCAGAVIVFLRRKDVRAFDCAPLKAESLIGTTVVLDPGQVHVLTAYRNRHDGMRRLKHKPGGSHR